MVFHTLRLIRMEKQKHAMQSRKWKLKQIDLVNNLQYSLVACRQKSVAIFLQFVKVLGEVIYKNHTPLQSCCKMIWY
ncbi:hypothetical protein quinque_013873 [Culex quinquefasciatus]|uniref:Uncharacterized protein n=1 Tax=Culex pipiens pipiens TaxID=38569 RepID=A0ABD1CP72_CULPP